MAASHTQSSPPATVMFSNFPFDTSAKAPTALASASVDVGLYSDTSAFGSTQRINPSRRIGNFEFDTDPAQISTSAFH